VLGQLQRTILQEVQTYAKGAGLDVVVSEALYASPSVDVTQQVLTALQARKGSAPAKP
jgi:Skp family chaperone for outer membrane proteins